MERLLKDAEKLTGQKYDISNLSDVYNAIHAIQENLGVTGTTAEEAEKTISGSINSMKASFDNFLNGSGSAEDLANSVTNVLSNIGDAIIKLAPNILNGIVTLIENLLPKVANLLVELLPQLLDAVSNMIDSLLNMVTQDLSGLQETLSLLVNKIVEFFTTNLPKIIELGLQLIIALAKGIADSLPTLIPQIIDCLIEIVEVIVDNLDLIIDAGLQLMVGLIEGFSDPDTMEKWMDKIPEIITKIVGAIVKNLPKILEAGGRILLALGQGLMTYYGKIGEWMGKIIDAIKDKIGNMGSTAITWGKDMINGFIEGIKKMIGKVGDAAKSIAEKIKSFLHFSKPDLGPLRDYETWMPDFMKGLVRTTKNSSYLLEKTFSDIAQSISDKMSFDTLFGNTNEAMKRLNYGVQHSLNPMINPNANSLMLNNDNLDNSNKNEKGNFTAIINNNSKYTSPSENVRLMRQEYELYKLKYGRAK